jgi:hypothetical protein
MFSSLHTIFNTSKIDKNNYKAKKINTYRESFQKTHYKQVEQLKQIKKISSEIIKKVDLDETFFVKEKIKEYESSIPESIFDIDYHSLIDPTLIQFDLNNSLFIKDRNLLPSVSN